MLNSPSDAGESYSDLAEMNEEPVTGSQVKFVINDASDRSSFRDDERERLRSMRLSSSASPGSTPRGERSGLFET
jgi:hypothetical protein